MPDIVLQKHMSLVDDKSLNAKESNGHKRKRIVEEGLPKTESPFKKKNKIVEEKPEETHDKDWKSKEIRHAQQKINENCHLEEEYMHKDI